MKDRIEIRKAYGKNGEEILRFYVHCDMGLLWLIDRPKTNSVYRYFAGGRSLNELRSYKYTGDVPLEKLIDRLPSYVKYAKAMALEEAMSYPEAI